MARRIITLTTDFGTADSYVAAMKGVILSINPDAHLVDLSHELAAHDLIGAALFLEAACRHFAQETIHLAVVDPGVGTARRAICVRTARSYYVAPDNGIVSLAIRAEAPYDAVELTDTEYHRTVQPSGTFHGRDVFAPVAAHLSLGTGLDSFGPPVGDLVEVDVPAVNRASPGVLEGEVIHIDRFGNMITNISRADWLDACRGTGDDVSSVVVQICGASINGLSRAYGDHEPGTLLALWGSSDKLEISVTCGNAAERVNATVGTQVRMVHRSSNG